MRKVVFGFFLCSLILFGFLTHSQAATQDECAIWLCLPGGFPQGCGGAYSAFKNRLKKRKSPLPSFSSCSIDGEGRYELGIEYYEPCMEGYELVYREGSEYGYVRPASCVSTRRECISWRDNMGYYSAGCKPIPAVRRIKPSFIEMWVNEEYIGKFYY